MPLSTLGICLANLESSRDACPCCGYAALNGRGEFDICPICWSEDDGQDNDDANIVRGGPNGILSLTEARINFIKHGIFCSSRTDLLEKQQAKESYLSKRRFIYNPIDETIYELRTEWVASTKDLDNNPKRSRFTIGDSVIVCRANVETTAVVTVVQWKANVKIWHYRLKNQFGDIGNWIDGAHLSPKNGG